MKCWEIMDPNEDARFKNSYRPIRIGPSDAEWVDGLHIGDASKDKKVLPLAEFLIYCVNNAVMTHKHIEEYLKIS